MRIQLAVILAVALGVPALAQAPSAPKDDPFLYVQTHKKPSLPPELLDGPEPRSFTLEGIVDSPASGPFACRFGRFAVQLIGRDETGLLAKMSGGGLLVNSAWLHTSVRNNPKITYLFAPNSGITDGAALTAYCTSSGKPGRAAIRFFVLERKERMAQRAGRGTL